MGCSLESRRFHKKEKDVVLHRLYDLDHIVLELMLKLYRNEVLNVCGFERVEILDWMMHSKLNRHCYGRGCSEISASSDYYVRNTVISEI